MNTETMSTVTMSTETSQESAPSASASRSTSYRRNWWVWGIPVFLTLLIAGAIITVAILLSEWLGSSVQGVELNAANLQHRDFSYRKALFSGRQIQGIQRTRRVGLIADYLAGRPWFTTQAPKARWDLAWDSTVSDDSIDWRARPLADLLDDEKFNETWLAWSYEHPVDAPSLWLAARELAVNDLYEDTPDLFLIAKSSESVGEVEERITEFLEEAYSVAAKEAQDPERKQRLQALAESSFDSRIAPLLEVN